jgi:beta-lactamase regulating signal transducer with metallopeptidase domain
MTAIAQALSAALLDFVWQGLLSAFLLWLALFILRNHSARARYAASCVALAVMAALPVVTACLVYRATAASQGSAGWTVAGAQWIRAAAQRPAASFNWAAWLDRWALPVWSIGVLLFSLRLLWAARQISVLRGKAQLPEAPLFAIVTALQVRLRIARPVRVLVSAAADCPSVVGWIRPILLLPAATVMGLTTEQLEAVLAHELAHILRYDHLVNMLQSILETLLFYHPAVWWTSARIRQERELCCDDLAVESCGDAVAYARALTRLERLRVMSQELALGSSGGPLLYRIQRLLGNTAPQRGPSKLPAILALSLGLVCLTLNLQWARGQQLVAATDSSAADAPGVHVDIGGAPILHREPVQYSGSALEKNIQGTVVVEATTDAAGMVSDARVLSGPQELRKAALESVLNWHFAHSAAGSTRQISIAFQKPTEDALTERSQDQAKLTAEARALEAAAREHSEVEGYVNQQLARKMAKRQRDSQERQAAEAMEQQAKRMAEMARELQATHSQEADQMVRPLAEAVDREQQMLELENQLKALLDQHVESGIGSNLLEGQRYQIPEVEKKLTELQMHFEGFRGPALAGRRLKAIDIQGLTAQAREELMSKLPVRVGDMLSEDSMHKIEEALSQFDEHLGLAMFTRDGQVEIRITAPGLGDNWDQRR